MFTIRGTGAASPPHARLGGTGGRVAISMSADGAVTASARVRAHVALTKPRIVELLLATALPTTFLAAGGLPPLVPTIAVMVGGTLAAGSANTFNSVYDRDIDALMGRTFHRPAAMGVVSVRAGIAQGRRGWRPARNSRSTPFSQLEF